MIEFLKKTDMPFAYSLGKIKRRTNVTKMIRRIRLRSGQPKLNSAISKCAVVNPYGVHSE